VRIAKSSKEQDGYEAPDTDRCPSHSEAPKGRLGSHLVGDAK
jgi:hypothetical protein